VYDQKIRIGVLPKSLTSLKCENMFNRVLKKGVLPPSLMKLKCCVDAPFTPGALPQSLTKLNMDVYDDTYNQPILPGALPSSLVSLRLGNDFDQIFTTLPVSLRFLDCGLSYNQPFIIGVLPSHLRELVCRAFEQELEPGMLPASLQILDLGPTFNERIPPGVLPTSLTCLYVGGRFNRENQGIGIPAHTEVRLLSKR
jgi:hypothetical protein